MPSKLTDEARADIELQLKAGSDPQFLAFIYRITPQQIWKMRRNLEMFGSVVAPRLQVQGRPRLITPEAEEGILEFLLEYNQQAYLDEIVVFLKEKYRIKTSKWTVEKMVKNLQLIYK